MPTEQAVPAHTLQLNTRFAPSDRSGVGKANSLRKRTQALQRRVSSGEYNQNDLEEFWSIISSAPNVLRVSSSQLSEASEGMTAHFFLSVVRDKRHPKLTNMLKALSAVASVANERLADVDRADAEKSTQAEVGWSLNPLYLDRETIEEAESRLRDIIEFLKQNNSLSNSKDIDEYWRASLIKTLETTLFILKAPLIEKSIINKSIDGLKKLSTKVASDSSAGFFGGLTGAAAAQLIQFLGQAK